MANILLAMSDKELREDIAGYLSFYGTDISVAGVSTGIVERIKKENIDLFICDMLLTPLNGYRLCKNIRASGDRGLAGIGILMVGPVEPEPYMYSYFEDNTIYFMNNYEKPEKWKDVIELICMNAWKNIRYT